MREAADLGPRLLPAAVLGPWFDSPIQVVVCQPELADGIDATLGNLGVAVVPAACFDDGDFHEQVAVLAGATGPSLLLLGSSDQDLELARACGQTAFLVADQAGPRLNTGPLVVGVPDGPDDLGALAVAATWSRFLDLSVRLVADAAEDSPDPAQAYQKLTEMGVDVGVDSLRPHGLEPLTLVARTRNATAVVVPEHRLRDREFVDRAIREGISILVAPSAKTAPSGSRSEALATPDSEQGDADPSSSLGLLSRRQCFQLLASQSVGRMAYVVDGWPTVVPVNYAVFSGDGSDVTDGADVIIRSLEGGKLQAARQGEVVCFQIDQVRPTTRAGWSVLAHGQLEVISDPSVLRSAWLNDPDPWVKSERWHWLRLVVFSISGRRQVETDLEVAGFRRGGRIPSPVGHEAGVAPP